MTSRPAVASTATPSPTPPPAQTEEILIELGLDWDRILALKAAGAIT